MTRLQRIQSRLARARHSGDLDQPWRVQFSENLSNYGFNVSGPTPCEDTATFIAHAPSDITYLLAEVERLTAAQTVPEAPKLPDAPDPSFVMLDSADALRRLMDQLKYSGNRCDFPVMNRHDFFYLAFGEDHSGEEMCCWLQPPDAGAPDFQPVPGYDQCEHCGQHGAIRYELDHTSYPLTAWLSSVQAAAVFHPEEWS